MNMGLYTHKISLLVRGLLEWYQKQIRESLTQIGQYLTNVETYVCRTSLQVGLGLFFPSLLLKRTYLTQPFYNSNCFKALSFCIR
ncbi:hypothetical protein VIGAN_11089900 [Vigna angularis var. angularis]|uniref:Uncharacterized protein n=1 Tax=Vigna angularis var. angularis TaxID=157739 RepID=A0A0S3T9Z2_PHAAN|nr:hypothetical protein VIGAN_11089900 [Vigna angularis var. angularis]